MFIKDRYHYKPARAPKSKGKKDIMEEIPKDDTPPLHTASIENKQKDVKKATFELDAKLHKRLRGAAAEYETTMVDILEKALNEYLDKLDNQ